jgi:hypothetical protein
MVSFGGNSKKKASSNDVTTSKVGTPTSTPTKMNKNKTSPKIGGGFFRKAVFSEKSTPTKNVITTTTPTTPPVTTPDSSSRIVMKERPTVDTIEVPLSSQIPVTPDRTDLKVASESSLLDNPNMYRVDSVLSDLSGSQPTTVNHNNNKIGGNISADPPALILRTNSIEAASGSSTSGYNSKKDPPVVVSAAIATTTTESIVTKVLGIVDMSCVSSGLVPTATPALTTTIAPSTKKIDDVTTKSLKDTTGIKPAYSFQPEWGIAPEDEELILIDQQKLLGSGGAGSNNSNDDMKNNNANGSTIKRELAEIAARVSAPSTLQYIETKNNNSSSRRYHETFELVYTEPTEKTQMKKSKTPSTITKVTTVQQKVVKDYALIVGWQIS